MTLAIYARMPLHKLPAAILDQIEALSAAGETAETVAAVLLRDHGISRRPAAARRSAGGSARHGRRRADGATRRLDGAALAAPRASGRDPAAPVDPHRHAGLTGRAAVSSILVHRLELAGRVDLALDGDMLDWLAETVGMGRSDIWLRHARGLVGELGGALRLLDDLFPGAQWAVGNGREPGGEAAHAVIVPVYATSPFVSSARDPANALIAATMRAFEAGALAIPFAANDRGVAA